ncbi:hypothetical protein GF373_02950, partial [bacterium]|nr:hypothetical protein [bacterium]
MRIRCLAVDRDPNFRNQLKAVFHDIPSVQFETAENSHDAGLLLQSMHPNIIFIACDNEEICYQYLFTVIRRLKLRTVVIPIIERPTAEILKSLFNQKFVIDILNKHVDGQRLKTTIQKAIDQIFGSLEKNSHYRGFVGFVGVTPTLRERKILQSARLGFVQNRSIRLAIDYWRKNPNSQLIAIIIGLQNRFSSRPDEIIDSWEGLDFKPWEIAMFEAQNHYMQYWRDPISSGLLPKTMPTMLRREVDDMELIHPKEQTEILLKISNKARRGDLERTLKSLGIKFHNENEFVNKPAFQEFVKTLEKKMESVEEEYPH